MNTNSSFLKPRHSNTLSMGNACQRRAARVGTSLLLALVIAACGDTSTQTEDSGSRDIPGLVLIDNMEDGNTQSLDDEAAFLGFWYTYDDRKDCREDYCCMQSGGGTLNSSCATNEAAGCPGTVEPVPEVDGGFLMAETAAVNATAAVGVDPAIADEVAESKYAARMVGEGYATWGAGMGITFKENAVYDAAAQGFTGIRFLAMSPLASEAEQAVKVKVQDISSEPSGGYCILQEMCGETEGCYADFGVDVTLTNVWTEFRITWDMLSAPSFGVYNGATPTVLDATQVFQLQFQTVDALSGGKFDIWVDNVGFILGDGTGG